MAPIAHRESTMPNIHQMNGSCALVFSRSCDHRELAMLNIHRVYRCGAYGRQSRPTEISSDDSTPRNFPEVNGRRTCITNNFNYCRTPHRSAITSIRSRSSGSSSRAIKAWNSSSSRWVSASLFLDWLRKCELKKVWFYWNKRTGIANFEF